MPVPEYGLYYEAWIERDALKIDTSIYAKQICVNEKVIDVQQRQLADKSGIIQNQETMLKIKDKDYATLAAKFTKLEKKLKLAKKVIAPLAVALLTTWAGFILKDRFSEKSP